jgi:hypothetical protein
MQVCESQRRNAGERQRMFALYRALRWRRIRSCIMRQIGFALRLWEC